MRTDKPVGDTASLLLALPAPSPRLAGHRRVPEGMPLPSVMRALMEFLGEDYGVEALRAHNTDWVRDKAHTHYMAVTGDAFRFSWAEWMLTGIPPVAAWDKASLEAVSHAFAACGHAYDLVLQKQYAVRTRNTKGKAAEEEALRRDIVASLRERAKPVVAAGVTAPYDVCLITGYEADGEVLVGWRTEPGGPGIAFAPEARFRQEGWYPQTHWIVTLGAPCGRPPLAQVAREALGSGLELMRKHARGQVAYGFDAYSAWAGDLLDETYFTGEAGDTGMHLIDPWIWDLAERRAWGCAFMQDVAAEVGAMGPPLRAAAACFSAEHDMMWEIQRLLLVPGQQGMRPERLADPEVRREIAAILTRAREQDMRAAEDIEKALKAG